MIKKIILKLVLYSFLLLLVLEILVRIFHLAKDSPSRYLDESKVEKWVPNQNGFSVTGNRRQNFSEFKINDFGFNSYREFKPSKDKVEIALVGDSFIEGFHQEYKNSIGRKIENKLKGIEVYEYGYSGYDMADQLHLINAYKDQFALIDMVVLGIKFENDLTRDKYAVEGYRLAMETPFRKLLKSSKLLVYTKSIGVFEPPKRFLDKIMMAFKPSENRVVKSVNDKEDRYLTYIENFESLITLYGFNKSKYYLLIDETKTPQIFMNYLRRNDLNYITIGEELSKSKRPTTLIYDMHWNNRGREIVAEKISNFYKNEKIRAKFSD